MKRLGLGFVGAGNIAGDHAAAFAKLDAVELVAVTDVRGEAARALAKKHGIASVHGDLDSMLGDAAVEALVVAVPNAMHEPVAVAAMRAGKHVMLEKPMGATLEAAERIEAVQRETGRVLMLAHQWRWTWWALAMKRRIDSGKLGRVYHARTGWMRRKGIPGWGTWFTRKQVAGGGPLIDIGVHMLDITLHLLGNPRPVAVSGATYAAFGPSKKGIGAWGTPDWKGVFDVEDLASAFIRMEDGSTLTLEVSWAVHSDKSDEYIDLLGEDGGLAYRHGRLKFLTERGGKLVDDEIAEPEVPVDDRDAMCRQFLECIIDGRNPWTSARSGLVNNAVLDGIYRSAESGREVEIRSKQD